MGRVSGKVALVTGGAAGLGQASAVLLAREGATVVVTDINEASGQATADSIKAAGGEALFLRQDVTSEAEWEAVIARTVKTYGRLDVLVNNAGVGTPNTVEDVTLDEWRQVQAVNLDGVFLGTKHGIRQMKQNGGGSIINISSIEGIIGEPMAAAYNASKGGVRIFTKSAALHCAHSQYNIRVNSVHPGFIETAMVQSARDAMPLVAEAFVARIMGEIPLGHMGEPMDIAYGVLYLASDESKYVTGSELVIDGGFTAH